MSVLNRKSDYFDSLQVPCSDPGFFCETQRVVASDERRSAALGIGIVAQHGHSDSAITLAGSPLLRRVSISAGVRVQRSGKQKSRIAKFTLDIDQIIHNHMVVDKLGTTFAALSDPTRRAMIERLSHGPASVHGLTEPFALSQQMISKHIAYLVRARIVIKTKRGRESVCTLRPQAIKTVSDWAFSYRRFWEESFDKLEVVVNQMKKEEARDGRKHGERN